MSEDTDQVADVMEAHAEQEQAEKERDEAEARFHAVFDVNPAPAAIVRLLDEQVLMVNSGFLELTGYERREARRKSLSDLALFVDARQREVLLDAPRRWQQSLKIETRLCTKSGDHKIVLCSARPLDFDGQTCGIITFADITEQKQAEERFSKTFHLAPIPTCLMNFRTGEFTDVNESFLELTGYNKLEVVRRTSGELGVWSPEARAKMTASLSGRDSFRNLELQIHTKSGERCEVLASAGVIDEGSVLLMFYDVTERKRNEEHLMQAIQEVMGDTTWFSRQVMERLANVRLGGGEPTLSVVLTPREQQVLERLAKGLNNEQIAEELGVARQTVRNYVTVVYEKLGVHSRAEAMIWARERGIVGR